MVVKNGQYKISHLRPYRARQLNRLFVDALMKDFSYYSDSYLRATRRSNSARRLALGSLRSNRLLLGLWHNGGLVGYLIGSTRPASSYGDIFWLYVSPNHRGRGLGADLLSEAIRWLRSKQLTVVELVTYDHVEFYQRHGFENQRLAKGFVGGKDVFIMKRALS